MVWATAQYLSYAHPPSVLDIDVTLAAPGRSITQARVVGHVADPEILTVNAALGTRDLDVEGRVGRAPDGPAARRVPGAGLASPGTQSIQDRIDVRLADARGVGRDRRPPGARRPVAAVGPHARPARPSVGASLAILGDYVPFGIGQALGRLAGGNSLDNTLRVSRLVPTEWVLLDIRIHAVANGFGHGVVHLWAEDGTLLATASQSTIVRLMSPDDAGGDDGTGGRHGPHQDPPAPV